MESRLEVHKMVIKRHLLKESDFLIGWKVIAKKPEEKRSHHDNSKWLIVVFKRDNCTMYAKISHNNNNRMRVDIPSHFEEGYEKIEEAFV